MYQFCAFSIDFLDNGPRVFGSKCLHLNLDQTGATIAIHIDHATPVFGQILDRTRGVVAENRIRVCCGGRPYFSQIQRLIDFLH